MIEIDRLNRNVLGESPAGPVIRLDGLSECADEVLVRTKAVMAVVLTAEQSDWRRHVWWDERLPDWFKSSFDHSLDEVLKNPELWDYHSWIDAIKYRGWEWWSTETNGNKLVVRLAWNAHPYVIEPFEYLLRSSGVREVKTSEEL